MCVRRDDTGINQFSLDFTGAYRSRIYTTLGSYGFHRQYRCRISNAVSKSTLRVSQGLTNIIRVQNLNFRSMIALQASKGLSRHHSRFLRGFTGNTGAGSTIQFQDLHYRSKGPQVLKTGFIRFLQQKLRTASQASVNRSSHAPATAKPQHHKAYWLLKISQAFSGDKMED